MANERLRTALLQRHGTIDDLADACGVDPKTAERWITVNRVPYRRHRYAAAGELAGAYADTHLPRVPRFA